MRATGSNAGRLTIDNTAGSDNNKIAYIEISQVSIAIGTQSFFPFGEVRTSTGIFDTARGFTGQIFDAGTGLGFYNARYYDTATGRFISPDSIVPDPTNPGLFNRFVYVSNNPLKYTDPSGHCGSTDMESLTRSEQATYCSRGVYTTPEHITGRTSTQFEGTVGDAAHALLDLAGFVPVVGVAADLLNAGYYGIEEDYGNAALSLAGVVPGSGVAATAGRFADNVVDGANTARRLGREGEEAAGIIKNTERIVLANGAKYRVPDGLNHDAELIREVKNVSNLSLTKQMQDIINYASENSYTFELYIRAGDGTNISKPLQKELDRIGAEIIRTIP